MTLGGLALAIGPLVDDAIVELENNHRNYSLGKSRIRAALDGCAEVMVPVLVATCTTNIVLAPLALMPGMGGFLFRPLALAVTFAMVSSFLLSRTFVPDDVRQVPAGRAPQVGMAARRKTARRTRAMRGTAIQPRPRHHEPTGFFGRLHHRIELFLERLTRRYEPLAANRPCGIGFGADRRRLLFVGSCCWRSRIGREFFPQVDAGQITMYVRAPSNLRLDASRAARHRGRAVHPATTSRRHELEMIVTEMGLDPDWSAAYTANSGQQDAVIRVQLNEKRSHSAQEYADPAAPPLRRRPALRRPARQLRHRRHGLHGAEQRRLLAHRHPDRGRQSGEEGHASWPSDDPQPRARHPRRRRRPRAAAARRPVPDHRRGSPEGGRASACRPATSSCRWWRP